MRHIDRIQRYLDGEMTEDELKSFKADLQKDPELMQELDLHRSLEGAILSKDEERFRKKLDDAYRVYKIKSFKDDESATLVRKTKKWKYIQFSGIGIILLFLGVYFMAFRKESNDSIFNKNLTIYNPGITLRSSSTDVQEGRAIQQAIKLYRGSNFSDASQILNSILRKDSKNVEAQFYNGLCLIYLNEIENAINSFEFVIDQPYNYFQEYAKWYLSMCYIKTKNNTTAKAILNDIVADSGFFSPRAKKILRKLK